MKRKTIIGAVLAIGVVGLGFAFWMMWRPEITTVSQGLNAVAKPWTGADALSKRETARSATHGQGAPTWPAVCRW